jgi:hypothetical protein
MIGYRIPTTSKSYMIVFKVVGFLPEESKGLVVTPDDMITQMGQDFDIDKWFIINKEFYTTKKGKFIIPKLGTKNEFNILSQEVKDLRSDLYAAGNDFATRKLSDDIAKAYGMVTTEELETELKDKEARLKELGEYNEQREFVFNKKTSKAQRNNEIFDIYKSILTNPVHFKEVLTPSGYPNITEIATKISKIYKDDDKNINPTTEKGQRSFRERNIIGKDLLGIGANLNGFASIAQITKMKLNNNIAFKFKYDLSKYDKDEIIKKYGEDVEIENGFAIVKHTNLGYNNDGSYTNIKGELILENVGEPVVAAADNAKDPLLEKLNLSTYTFPLFASGIMTGVPIEEMALFMRQPIIKNLNEYYFDSKSILSDKTGDQIGTIKRYYQTLLYKELYKDSLDALRKNSSFFNKFVVSNLKNKKDVDQDNKNTVVNEGEHCVY